MDYFRSLIRPKEFLALLKYRSSSKDAQKQLEKETSNMRRCYEFLVLTSRSFASVTMKLDREIRNAMCIFYLILRALDTVEDDMFIETKEKIMMLENFSEFLEDPDWRYSESSDQHKIVLTEFPKISLEFRQLKDCYQKIIKKTCLNMARGMVKHLNKYPSNIEQWDEYCYYVAGMLGEELSDIFVSSGLEDSIVLEHSSLSRSMGTFLQKSNIIRDYLDDVKDGRYFWPASVWKKYVPKLEDFTKDENIKLGVYCSNELITNALHHAQDVIQYLSNLKNNSIFQFCAIPQVMAIATLERCYDNSFIFRGIVKIRKGEAALLINQADNIIAVKKIFHSYATKIKNKIPARDPSAVETMLEVERIIALCREEKNRVAATDIIVFYVVLPIMTIFIYFLFGTFGSK